MSIVRVQYRERQRLNASDMRQEQDYRLGIGGRHDLAWHDWGIVRGLRVVVKDGGYLLTPGVAIDGYGREIAVSRALPVDAAALAPGVEGDVQLSYREQAQQASRGQSIGDQLAPRIGPRPMVVAVAVVDGATAPLPPLPGNLADARAAGVKGLAPWPVSVAKLSAAGEVDNSLTRYVAHRAATIRTPNRRAHMQLGLANRVDFYHFLLSTRNAASSLDKRIGIDRHGIVHFWRNLNISGTKAEANVTINDKQLKITVPIAAGTGSSAPMVVRADTDFVKIMASLRGGAAAMLTFQDGRIGAVKPLATANGNTVRFSKAAAKEVRRYLESEGCALSDLLVPLDATLKLKDVRRSGTAESELSALCLRPAKEIGAAPLAREVHAIDTSLPSALMPSTELRVTGGLADDSDSSTRMSIGIRMEGSYYPAFQMDGGRRLEIGTRSEDLQAPVLKVNRTMYLPPIGGKDPLLPELLLLAYMGGLRRSGQFAPEIKATLSQLIQPEGARRPTRVPGYAISIQAPSQDFTIKRAIELVTGAKGKGDLTFRSLSIPAKADGILPRSYEFELPALRRTEPLVQVSVLLLVETKQKVYIVASKDLEIDLDKQAS